MKSDIEQILELLRKFEDEESEESTQEMKEQEAGGAGASSGGSTGGGGGVPSVPKWADVVGGPKRGKANMLGKKGEKWTTGLNRGVANQLW
jgi:hypothetical protein